MMIKEITDLLAVFGGNLPLIAVGCVEGIAAVVLLGTGLQRKQKKETGPAEAALPPGRLSVLPPSSERGF